MAAFTVADCFVNDLMDGQLAAIAALIVATRAAGTFFAESVGRFFRIRINDSAAIKINLAARRLFVGGRSDHERREESQAGSMPRLYR